jgi:hypothetical protein
VIVLTPADRRVWAALCCERTMTLAEIAARCGLRSTGTVWSHLHRLERVGVVERVPFCSRAYRVIQLYSWVDV